MRTQLTSGPEGAGHRPQHHEGHRDSEQLLTALEQRRGDVIHANLSPAVKGGLSPQQVQDRLNQLPAILSSRIVLVASGYRTTTVDALLKTARGEEDLLLVLDDDGKLLAWKWVDAVQPIERTALDFAADLAAGRWLAARSKLSLDLQRTWPPMICGANGSD